MRGASVKIPREVLVSYRPTCMAALRVIFKADDNPSKRQRMYFHSYACNLDQMIAYALEKQIDPVKYVASLRDVFQQKQR